MLVGKDVEAAEGLRVIITEEGKNWDITKAKRGDSSHGAAGCVVEVRDGGKICMVQWDHGGDVLPYPTGVLNRFYLSLDPSEAPEGPTNESLSLSLISEAQEDSSPLPSPSMQLLDPSPAPEGARKRKSAKAPPTPASPQKKPASDRKGKGYQATHIAEGNASAESAGKEAGAGAAGSVQAGAAGDDSEEDVGDTPTNCITLLINGRWKHVALHPPQESRAVAGARGKGGRRALSFEVEEDAFQAGGGDGGDGKETRGEEAQAEVVVEEEEGGAERDARERDMGTWLSFLERSMSSSIYLESLATLTCSMCYASDAHLVDTLFFDAAAASLEAEQVVYCMQHYMDQLLHAEEPSPEEMERLAFADAPLKDVRRTSSSEDAFVFARGRAGGSGKKGGTRQENGKGSRGGKGAAAEGKGVGEVQVDVQTAAAGVNAACVILTVACSKALQCDVLKEDSCLSALRVLQLVLGRHHATADASSAQHTPSRRRSASGGSRTSGPGALRTPSKRRAAAGAATTDSICCALAALAHLTHVGALSEEALFATRKVAAAALTHPAELTRRSAAQLHAALARTDEHARGEVLVDLFDVMISPDMAADARGPVRLWGGMQEGQVVAASSAALLLLCQLSPAPVAHIGERTAAGAAGVEKAAEMQEAGSAGAVEEVQGEAVTGGRRGKRGKREGRRGKGREKDGAGAGGEEQEREADQEEGMGAREFGRRDGGGGGRDLCKMFFDLVGHRALGRGRSGQAKDVEMRFMLECLLDDLSRLVYAPEWPAAEALLNAMNERLAWIVAGKKSDKGCVAPQYKALALELMGSLIQLASKHARLAALPLAVDLGDVDALTGAAGSSDEVSGGGCEPVEGSAIIGATIDKYFENHGVFAGSVVSFHARDPPEQAANLWTVRFADGDEEDFEWPEIISLFRPRGGRNDAQVRAQSRTNIEDLGDKELRRRTAYRHHVMRYLCNNPGKLPRAVLQGAVHYYEVCLHWEEADVVLRAGRGSGVKCGVDDEVARSLGRRLAQRNGLMDGNPKRLNLMLSVLNPCARNGRSGKGRGGGGGKVGAGEEARDGEEVGGGGLNARLRQGVLKVLADAVRNDPQILEGSQVLQAVRHRYVSDISPLVRSASVDILSAFIAHSRGIGAMDLGALCVRARDVSTMVRQKAADALATVLALGREYRAKELAGERVGVSQAHKDEALVRLCGLAVDQEPTVRKKALRHMVEMWFFSADRESTFPPMRGKVQESGDAEYAGHKQAMLGVLDEFVTVAMHTVCQHARKGAGSESASGSHKMCLLRRVMNRILDNASAAADSNSSSSGTPATPKGKSPSGKGAKAAAAGGSAQGAVAGAADATDESAASGQAVMIGAEDETMDAGGATAVIVVSAAERRVVEQRCRAVCGLLLQRVSRLRPKPVSSSDNDDDDAAGSAPSDAAAIVQRLESLLGASCALLSLLQTIPSLAWSIPNVTTLIDAELAETQPLEHIVGDASRYYGLRMRIIAQSALLADALIAAAPPAHVQRELLPVTPSLQRHLASAANRVRHQATLNAVIKCLCTLSLTTLPSLGSPTVAFLSFCKYVEFVAKFVKHRSQRLLPFVSSALLGAGALCRYLDWKVLLTALKDKDPTNSQAAERLGRFERYHSQMTNMCVGVLAHDQDERVRRCAMQCLGGMLVYTPSLLLERSTARLVKQALQGKIDQASQQAVLEAFRVFLEEEDKNMTTLQRQRPASSEAAVEAQRVSSMSTVLANDYLPLIIHAAFPRQDEMAASHTNAASALAADADGQGSSSLRVREEAMALIKVIIRRGLTAPSRVTPSLIALSAWGDEVAATATQVFDHLHRKNNELSQPSMLIAGINVFIARQIAALGGEGGGGGEAGGDGAAGAVEEGDENAEGAGDFSREGRGKSATMGVAERCQPLHCSAFGAAFSYSAGSALQARKVVQGLLNLLEKEGRKEEGDGDKTTLQQRAHRMELLAHACANLPFQSLDAPLYAIHHIATQVPMLGTIALQGIKELVRSEAGEEDDSELMDREDVGAEMRGVGEGEAEEARVCEGVEGKGAEGEGAEAEVVGGEEEQRHGLEERDGAGVEKRQRRERKEQREHGLTNGERNDRRLNACRSKGIAATLLLHLCNYFKSAYNLSDAKVRGFKPNGPIGAREATSSDILPPFRPPSLLFFPDPSPLDSLDSLAERAEDLARLMQDNAVLMGRDPAEGIGGTRQDGEGGGENVEEEDGAEESALAKGGGKKGERGDCGEEDGGSPAKRARGGGVKDHFRVHKPGRKSSGGTRR